MLDIQIYTKTDCPFCVQAKQWFNEHTIEYTEHLMNNEEERLAFYQRINNVSEQLGVGRNGINSVPQIYMNNERIGGYSELIKVQDKILRARGGGLTVASQTYKPFYYAWAVDLTVRHEKAHWIEDEIDLGEDVSDWKTGKVTKVEKDYITNVLRLFTQSDVAVGQNYYDQFIPKFKNNEVRNMLGSFANREGVHQRAYALLNDTLGLPDSEYHAFLEYKEMTNKIDFMQKSDNSTQRGLALAMAKSVFNEGVALFASFVMLLNFQRVGKMKGMGKVVEWSIRDSLSNYKFNSRTKTYESNNLEAKTTKNVDETLDRIREANVGKGRTMRNILADIWNMGEGKSVFDKEEKLKKEEEDEKGSSKTMTGKKATKVEIEPEVK